LINLFIVDKGPAFARRFTRLSQNNYDPRCTIATGSSFLYLHRIDANISATRTKIGNLSEPFD